MHGGTLVLLWASLSSFLDSVYAVMNRVLTYVTWSSRRGGSSGGGGGGGGDGGGGGWQHRWAAHAPGQDEQYRKTKDGSMQMTVRASKGAGEAGRVGHF